MKQLTVLPTILFTATLLGSLQTAASVAAQSTTKAQRQALKDLQSADKISKQRALLKLGDSRLESQELKPILALMKSPDPLVRAWSLRVLSKTAENSKDAFAKSHWPTLRACFTDPHPLVQELTAEVASRWPTPLRERLSELKGMLQSESQAVCITALKTIQKLGLQAGETAPLVFHKLSHSQPSVRRQAAKTLIVVAIHSPKVVVSLARKLTDPNRHVRALAAQTLVTMGPRAAPAIPVLEELLGSRFREFREHAIAAFVAIGERSRFPLKNRFRNSQGHTQRSAAEALVKLGGSADGFLEALESPDPELGRAAAYALAKMGARASSVRTELIQDMDDPELRASAIIALTGIRLEFPKHKAYIDSALKSKALPEQCMAVASLAPINSQTKAYLPQLKALTKNPAPSLRRALLETLPSAGFVASRSLLCAALTDSRTMKATADALCRGPKTWTRDPELPSLLVSAFDSVEDTESTLALIKAAAVLLKSGQRAPKGLIQKLLAMLTSPLPSVQSQAIVGLTALGADSQPALLKRAKQPDFDKHPAILRALWAVDQKSEGTLSKLEETLVNRREDMFEQALLSLCEHDWPSPKITAALKSIAPDNRQIIDEPLKAFAYFLWQTKSQRSNWIRQAWPALAAEPKIARAALVRLLQSSLKNQEVIHFLLAILPTLREFNVSESFAIKTLMQSPSRDDFQGMLCETITRLDPSQQHSLLKSFQRLQASSVEALIQALPELEQRSRALAMRLSEAGIKNHGLSSSGIRRLYSLTQSPDRSLKDWALARLKSASPEQHFETLNTWTHLDEGQFKTLLGLVNADPLAIEQALRQISSKTWVACSYFLRVSHHFQTQLKDPTACLDEKLQSRIPLVRDWAVKVLLQQKHAHALVNRSLLSKNNALVGVILRELKDNARSLQPYLKALQAKLKQPQQRSATLRLLSHSKPASMALQTNLDKLLESPLSVTEHSLVLDCLRHCPSTARCQRLLKILGHKDKSLRQSATSILAEWLTDRPSWWPRLMKCCQDPEWLRRAYAFKVLASIKLSKEPSKEASLSFSKALILGLKDSDARVRWSALGACDQLALTGEELFQATLKGLTDPDSDVQWLSLHTLRHHSSQRPAILNALKKTTLPETVRFVIEKSRRLRSLKAQGSDFEGWIVQGLALELCQKLAEEMPAGGIKEAPYLDSKHSCHALYKELKARACVVKYQYLDGRQVLTWSCRVLPPKSITSPEYYVDSTALIRQATKNVSRQSPRVIEDE